MRRLDTGDVKKAKKLKDIHSEMSEGSDNTRVMTPEEVLKRKRQQELGIEVLKGKEKTE